MYHILRVLTRVSYDGDNDHGFFPAEQLEEAIECAKAHISAHETTLILVVPFGSMWVKNAQGKLERDPVMGATTLWKHVPAECKRKLGKLGMGGRQCGYRCEVCEASIRADEEYEAERKREQENAPPASGETVTHKPLTCDKCGHENQFLAPECAGEPCRKTRFPGGRGGAGTCDGHYRKVG